MVNKTISLTEEMFNKLKGEENASALIDGLLRDFYKYNTENIDEINRKINELRERKKEFGKEAITELEKLERVKDKIEAELKEKKEQEEKNRLWLEEFRAKFKTEEEMKEFVSNASEQLKHKFNQCYGKQAE